MRRGLMLWREQELSAADVKARQQRLEGAMKAAGLDAFLVYTNHVRSAGVTYLTGFTPYWSDALLLILPGQSPLFSTALSKRVGNWIRSVNPTAEIAHSPKPGRLIGERLASAGCKCVGVLELDRLPAGLAEEIALAADVELLDGTEVFASVRAKPDSAELGLVRRADALALEALGTVDPASRHAGQAVAALERVAREAGAEECYIAIAPHLDRDTRPGRFGGAELGRSFAVRLSLAYNGAWVRRTRTFSRDAALQEQVQSLERAFAALAPKLDPVSPLGPQLKGLAAGADLARWSLEAPSGTLPLAEVANENRDTGCRVPYGVLSAAFMLGGTTVLLGGPVGLDLLPNATEEAA